MNERIYLTSIFIYAVVIDLALLYRCRVMAYQKKTLLKGEDEFGNLYFTSVSRSCGFHYDDDLRPILVPPSPLSSASPKNERGGSGFKSEP